jgi:sulfotransferase 6B1
VINSIPKAGTHLVASVLSRVPKVNFSGIFIAHDFVAGKIADREGDMPAYDKNWLREELSKIRAGTFANCHLFYDAHTRDLLAGPDLSAVFVVRDPRDIIISQLNYIEQFQGHHFHRHLTRNFPTRTERLDALIYGWEPTGPIGGVDDLPIRGMADVGTRLRSFRGWSEVLPTFKFEQFASAQDRESLDQSLHRLLEAVGLVELCDVDTVRGGIGDKWSATFNNATAGNWTKELSARQASAVADLAGDFISEYEY